MYSEQLFAILYSHYSLCFVHFLQSGIERVNTYTDPESDLSGSTARKHERTPVARVDLISNSSDIQTQNGLVGSMLVLAEIYGGQALAHLARRITTSVCITESELTVAIPTPTLHGCVVKECARVLITNSDCRCHTTCVEIHGGQVIAHLARRITTMVCITESEMAV